MSEGHAVAMAPRSPVEEARGEGGAIGDGPGAQTRSK